MQTFPQSLRFPMVVTNLSRSTAFWRYVIKRKDNSRKFSNVIFIILKLNPMNIVHVLIVLFKIYISLCCFCLKKSAKSMLNFICNEIIIKGIAFLLTDLLKKLGMIIKQTTLIMSFYFSKHHKLCFYNSLKLIN